MKVKVVAYVRKDLEVEVDDKYQVLETEGFRDRDFLGEDLREDVHQILTKLFGTAEMSDSHYNLWSVKTGQALD